MTRTVGTRAATAAVSAVLMLGSLGGGSVVAADKAAWVPGTESMPPAPTGAQADRLAALYNVKPVNEMAGDVTVAVVSHVVWAKVAADEEWGAFYGNAWQTQAEARMESADDALYLQFGIDFQRYAFYAWDSGPDTSRPICGSGGLLEEMMNEIGGPGSADVITAFTNNASSGSAGCASGNHTIVKLHGSTTAQREYNVWATARHEYSHQFGAPDRYPDPNNLHTNDIMEDHYNYPNLWCTQPGYNDWGIVNSHRTKYD